jgi:hypothetical protein
MGKKPVMDVMGGYRDADPINISFGADGHDPLTPGRLGQRGWRRTVYALDLAGGER